MYHTYVILNSQWVGRLALERMGGWQREDLRCSQHIKNNEKAVCASEKAMAPHSSALAWRIPGTGEPGGLPSMGSHKVGHD